MGSIWGAPHSSWRTDSGRFHCHWCTRRGYHSATPRFERMDESLRWTFFGSSIFIGFSWKFGELAMECGLHERWSLRNEGLMTTMCRRISSPFQLSPTCMIWLWNIMKTLPVSHKPCLSVDTSCVLLIACFRWRWKLHPGSTPSISQASQLTPQMRLLGFSAVKWTDCGRNYSNKQRHRKVSFLSSWRWVS